MIIQSWSEDWTPDDHHAGNCIAILKAFLKRNNKRGMLKTKQI